MFVGDKGHDVGSHIKRHQRYGDKWKQELHSRFTPTMIKNEHSSSQACLFCFQKLSHTIVVSSDKINIVTVFDALFSQGK